MESKLRFYLRSSGKFEFGQLGYVKAWVQNLMEIGIKNLVYMVFSPLPWHNHQEIKRVNENYHEYNNG